MRHIWVLLAFLIITAVVSLNSQVPADFQIHIYDREGNVVRRIGNLIELGVLSLSPDNTRVAIVRNGDIWTFDIASGTPTQVTSQPTGERQPSWSPDSQSIAYESLRAGIDGLYRKASDGTGDEELLSAIGKVAMNLTSWSPDGRFLTYYGGPTTDLWVFSLAERKPIELTRTRYAEVAPRISPDGRYIAYRSNESGVDEAYVSELNPALGPESWNTAAKWKISNKGSAGMIRWRSDGLEMYYLAADGGVMAVPVTTTPSFTAGPPTLLFRVPANFPLLGQPGRLGDVNPDGTRFGLVVRVAG